MAARSNNSGGIGCRSILNGFLAVVVVLALIGGFLIFSPFHGISDLLCKATHTKVKALCRGIIDVQSVPVGNDTLYIGLSEGYYAFDVNSDAQNRSYKQQAIDAMNSGRIDDAISAWSQAINTTTNDAESMIYRENAQTVASQQPYVTVVVTTTLSEVPGDTSSSISVARDDLRGVYLAQRDFNAQHAHLKLRIVLANLGVKAQDYLNKTEDSVIQKIVRLARTDDTFIGVVGFPFSSSAALAIPALTAEHVPIISPSASSKSLSDISPYFFRVIPSDAEQGKYAAQFASTVLNVHRVAVLSDNTSSYSQSLGESFTTSFNNLGSSYTVIPEQFTLHTAASLNAPLKNILAQNPPVDMIFLAGYADDLNNLKSQLGPNASSLPIMGGDAFYELGSYTARNYSNFYFTAFNYPDTWNLLCPPSSACATLTPSVVKNYSSTFDPKGLYPGQYSYARTGPHVSQSYDAMFAMLAAVDSVISNGQTITREAIRDAIQQISFQGATGEISFHGSDPVNKTVVLLCVDSNSHTQLVRVYGKFAQGARNYQIPLSYIRNGLCA